MQQRKGKPELRVLCLRLTSKLIFTEFTSSQVMVIRYLVGNKKRIEKEANSGWHPKKCTISRDSDCNGFFLYIATPPPHPAPGSQSI